MFYLILVCNVKNGILFLLFGMLFMIYRGGVMC